VIFDVQRAGPSTGLPTRTMQGDVSFAYTLSHGDTKHIVLLARNRREAYEFAMEAFDLAERFQTPVFVLSDLDLGMNSWLTPPLPYPEKAVRSRKVLGADDLNDESWGRYRDVDNDGIPYRTLPGTNHRTPGSSRAVPATTKRRATRRCPTSGSAISTVWCASTKRRARPCRRRSSTRKGHPACDPCLRHDASRRRRGARPVCEEFRHRVDYMRVRALPLSPEVATFIARHDRVYVVEQNRDGQLYGILRTSCPHHDRSPWIDSVHYNGVPIDAHAIVDPLLEAEREPAVVAEIT
jgi:2-oxoglutarate ferredoxin oxidoreductase subunit alpha